MIEIMGLILVCILWFVIGYYAGASDIEEYSKGADKTIEIYEDVWKQTIDINNKLIKLNKKLLYENVEYRRTNEHMEFQLKRIKEDG